MTGSKSRPLRILEVGDQSLFKTAAPEQTDFHWAAPKPRGNAAIALGPLALLRAMRRLRRGEYDLLAIHVALYPLWHPRTVLTVLRDWHVRAPLGLFALAAWHLVQRFHRVPIVAIDLNDSFGINRHAFSLIDVCRGYFKRELPADRWLAFHRTGISRYPGARWRRNRRNQQRVGKLRPLSFGSLNPPSQPRAAPKTTDVFFAGAIEANSTVRAGGLAELLALREEGYVIDIPDRRLDFAEFERRAGQAWLAWSPGGLGWDCGRHYEVAWVGTVPVMNYPTILRDQPFRDGEHCVLYAPESGGLAAAVRAALADKPRLAEMGRAAAAHAHAHHTVRARAERVAIAALGRRFDGTPV